MRKFTFILVAFGFIQLFSACNKQSVATAPAAAGTQVNSYGSLSNSDMSQAVTNAVSGSSSGLVTQSQTAARVAGASTLACGQVSDTTISASSPAGSLISYNYNLVYNRSCVCNNGVVTQVNTNISGSSGYSGIFMSSTDSTSAQMSISGVQSSAASYVLNETYIRKGTLQSFISNQPLSGTLTFTSTNISIGKSNNQILSGSASAQFTGTDFSGKAFSRSASITFLGNNQATLILDNGNASTISW